MKTLFFVLLSLFSFQLFADTGDFEIQENDFKSLFNQNRVGQPEITPWAGTFWPYGYNGTAAKVENGNYTKSDSRGVSPLENFDKIAKL
ncbi:MAG: hypothetical protein AB7O96_15085, partial [Pseudobdellovibrionaceae bacterium]